jgi:hypothetical protein
MVAIGDKLGGRYFVTKLEDKPAVGSLFEVRDAQGTVFHAQLLHAGSITQSELNALAREVASVPHSPALALPDEITQAPSGEPFALYAKAPPKPLAGELAVLVSGGNPDRRLAAQRTLMRAFATLAEEYDKAVGARSAHGAISLQTLGVVERGDDLKLALSGFGLEATARIAGKKERPAAKADPSALVLMLHEALSKCMALPEGTAQVKWSIVQSCARAGDHPALQSAAALAKFLRDLVWEIEQAARAPTPSMKPPPDKNAPKPVEAPPTRGAQKAPADATSAPAGGASWAAKNRNTLIFAGVGLVGVAALTLFGGDDLPSGAVPLVPSAPAPSQQPQAAAPGAAAAPGVAAAGACGAEPIEPPTTVEIAGAASFLDGLCTTDASSLRLVTASGAALTSVERPARRGGAFAGAPRAWTDRMAEPGSMLTTATGNWVAWRPSAGAPFAITRLGAAPAEMPLAAGPWTGGAFHGAFLLDVTETAAWVASTLDTPQGPQAVAVRLSWGAASEAPVTVYRLSAGSVVAVIPSSPAQLLVRTTRDRQHTFSSITASVSVIPVLAVGGAPDDAGAAPALREVPEVSLQRTASFVVEADAVDAAPYGVAPPNAPRYYMLTAGRAPDAGSCSGARCVAEGVVSLVAFPSTGDASPQVLTERGRGVDLALNGGDQPIAVACESASCALYTRVGIDVPTAEPLSLRDFSIARLVRCGADAWLAFGTAANPAHVGALPLPCVSRRPASR